MIIYMYLIDLYFVNSEIAEKRKQTHENQQSEGEVVIETALDYEDQCMKQLQAFTFADRKTGKDGMGEQTAVKKPAGVLKNLDKVLDKKLVLIVYNQAKSQWQLPEMEWSQSDESLRNVSNDSFEAKDNDNIIFCNDNLYLDCGEVGEDFVC